MALSGNHAQGDPGHVTDHNLIDTFINTTANATFGATAVNDTGSALRGALDTLYRYGRRRVLTTTDLLAAGFKAFHRGSGANGGAVSPELTLEALRNAVADGAKVIDLDVQTTADGVIVAFHDTTLTRMTGVSGNVSDYLYHQLPKVDATLLLGSGWGTQTIPTLEQVIDEFGGRVLVNVEPKDAASVTPLVAMIVGYGLERSVLVNSSDDSIIAAASAAGIYTWRWGCDTTAKIDSAVAVGARILEIPYSAWVSTPTLLAYAQGKKGAQVQYVICGPILRRVERDAVVAAGFDAYVNDAPGYLDQAPVVLNLQKDISSQKIGPGILDSSSFGGVARLTATGYQLSTASVSGVARRFGHLSFPKATTYSLEFKWTVTGADADTNTRPTLRFACIDDRATGVDADAAPGYECDIRVSGQMRANKGGVGSYSALGTLNTGLASTGGVQQSIKAYVTPTTIAFVRTDANAATLSSSVSGTVTSLPVNALAVSIASGTVLRLANGQYATVSSTASAGATSIAINSLAVTGTVASASAVRWTLGPYSDTSYRGDYIYAIGSSGGGANHPIVLNDVIYTAGDV